jgi:hypothetical protein
MGDHQHDCPNCNGYTVCYTKDCFAPGEQETLCHDCLRKDNTALRAALAAAIAAKEEAERRLCLIRSEVDKAIHVLKIRMESDGTPRDFIVEDLERVHYSDTPCRHAAEADAMRKASSVDYAWVIEAGDIGTPRYWDGRGTDTFTYKNEDAIRFSRREDAFRAKEWILKNHALRITEHGWDAELRRRADAALKGGKG